MGLCYLPLYKTIVIFSEKSSKILNRSTASTQMASSGYDARIFLDN